MREEYAAPWRHKITVAALQEEMSNRSAKRRSVEVSEERREDIKEVLVETTSMWIQSLQHTVWPNIVFMVSEEIGRRSRRGRENAGLLCHQKEVRVCREQHGAQLIPLPHGAPRQRRDRLGSVAGHGEPPVQDAIRSQAHRSTTLLLGQLAAGVGERGGRRHGDALDPSTYKCCFMFPKVSCAVRMCYISLPLLFRMLRTNDQLCIAPNKQNWESGSRQEELHKGSTTSVATRRAAPEGLPRHVRVGLGPWGRNEPQQSGWGHWATASSRECGGKFRGRRAGSADNKPSGHRAGRAAVGAAAVGPSSR